MQVYYDPKLVSYEELLDLFFQRVDPTTLNQQGNDRGTQYRSGIYYHNEAQEAAAEKVGFFGLKALRFGAQGSWDKTYCKKQAGSLNGTDHGFLHAAAKQIKFSISTC